jgi:SAM-dependent methyltransferase
MPHSEPYTGLSKVYDALLGDRFFARARANFERLRQRFGLRPASAADVACGTGSFARYLNSLEVPRVYGVDRSLEMLRLAAAKNHGKSVRFLHQDFHSLRLPETVDLITCNFDSLNYLLSEADLLRALQRFEANLIPGGWAVFDLITKSQPWGSQPLREHRVWPGGEFWREMQLDPRSGLQNSLVRVRLGKRVYRERHHQRAYPLSAVERALLQAGLSLVEARDFYSWGVVCGQTRRVVIAARKPWV